MHGWVFDRFTQILTYKAKTRGIKVEDDVDEEDTSRTCPVCGQTEDGERVERGLYVCEACDAAFNADVNEVENIRRNINGSNSESPSGDRSTGWLAQPGVYLYDLTRGFQPRAEVVDAKP